MKAKFRLREAHTPSTGCGKRAKGDKAHGTITDVERKSAKEFVILTVRVLADSYSCLFFTRMY